MISRAKRAQVNKQQEKNLFRKTLLQFITKYGCGDPFKNLIYETPLPSSRSISENLLSRHSYCVILKAELMGWFVKSSPPASPP